MYRWQIATPQEYTAIRNLFLNSGICHSEYDVHRRVNIPFQLKQMLSIYRNESFCGFITVAFLDDHAEINMTQSGIRADDWRSGENFWVIDYVVKPHADGFKILRMLTKELGIKKARYFRDKFKEMREVRA